jgi:hypothetical protein
MASGDIVTAEGRIGIVADSDWAKLAREDAPESSNVVGVPGAPRSRILSTG